MDIKEQIYQIILDTQNDINQYLQHDSIPLECYADDINYKMDLMKREIKEALDTL